MPSADRQSAKPTSDLPKVVIVGAGFAGLQAAKRLAGKDVAVTVVDRRNHHLFQPLLYQVATAGLASSDIATPIRAVFRRRRNTEILMGTVERFDLARRRVILDRGGELPYDYLIVASGATTSYFNHPEWAALAPSLKSLEDAIDIRRRILVAFEIAERTTCAEERDALLTFVIVGGGPTGVELAGAIAELSRFALARDFDHINPRSAKILLVEGGPRLLPSFSPELSKKTLYYLVKLGVQVYLGKRVTEITSDHVTMDDVTVAARTTIWAAGVRPSPLGGLLGAPLDRSGRVCVEADLSLPGHPEVFVVGDLAAVPWRGAETVPGMAPGAMQEGRHAAGTIRRALKGQPSTPFHYLHKGSMATIGRAAAVVELGALKLSGLVAWLAWLVVHILYLIGFRSRLMVLIDWAWSYLTYQRGSRLITEPTRATGEPLTPATHPV